MNKKHGLKLQEFLEISQEKQFEWIEKNIPDYEIKLYGAGYLGAWYPAELDWDEYLNNREDYGISDMIASQDPEITNERKEKIDADLFVAKQSREEAENSKMDQEKSILDAKEKAIIIIRDAVEKSKSQLLISENKAKEKLSKKLEDAEKNILNAKKDSLKIVNEVASDIAVIISDKVSGIKISKNLILKSVNDKIKKSN